MDVDAFFAAVEQMDFPELKGKPVIVGGTSSRGVVATCSYEARVYGVHSAMPTFMAKKLCPDGIFIRGRHDRYAEISFQIFKILEEMSDHIEKVSIDEAYIDVTHMYLSAEYIGEYIKKRIKEEVGIVVSVGISYNKFLAKLASEWNKPDGFFIIQKNDIPAILKPLPILKIHGLGQKSAEKLNNIGIYIIEDLLKYKKEVLVDLLGSMGEEIYYRIRGIDEREVGSHTQRKSIGTEMTFAEDIDDIEEIASKAYEYLHEITDVLLKKNMIAKTIILKIKFEDFTQVTRSKSLEVYTDDEKNFKLLLKELLSKIEYNGKVRLLGITLANLISNSEKQLAIFDIIGEKDGK